MKKGDVVQVRVSGGDHWVECRVELASANAMSIALSADEGLPLCAIDPAMGRQVLLLAAEGLGAGYRCIHTGRLFDVLPDGPATLGESVTSDATPMIAIPIQTENHELDTLILVLSPDNLERMKAADPADVALKQLEGFNLVNPHVIVCYEEPTPELMEILECRDVAKIIAHLRRGWQHRPDLGDHDRGPEEIREAH